MSVHIVFVLYLCLLRDRIVLQKLSNWCIIYDKYLCDMLFSILQHYFYEVFIW